jgi:hypothetical protein
LRRFTYCVWETDGDGGDANRKYTAGRIPGSRAEPMYRAFTHSYQFRASASLNAARTPV